LVRNAVLRRSPFEPEGLAAGGLLRLPNAARVEGNHVVVPVRQSGHLVGLIPRQVAQVVRPVRPRAPLLVVRQHQVVVLVIAALLLGSLQTKIPYCAFKM